MKRHGLYAVPVSFQDATGAYALLALTRPALDLDGWASALPSKVTPEQEAGFIGLQDGRGCIHSLFTFQATQSAEHGPTLQLCEFTSLRLPGTLVIQELLRFANERASKLGISSIAIEMISSNLESRDREALEQRGFAVERVTMRGESRHPALQVIGGNEGMSVARPLSHNHG
ncbi:MAG: hypothetical protein DI537_35370 [Stutzerimonas stutzeri]|nr:MAG: hypothetical protein DI537_35370 [Stutzerimonas stutzeri]